MQQPTQAPARPATTGAKGGSPTRRRGGLLGQVGDAYSKPFQFSSLGAMPTLSFSDLDAVDISQAQTAQDPRALIETLGRSHALARPEDYGAQIADVERATFERAMNRLRPELDRQQSALNIDLINRGLPIGSEASIGARDRFDDARSRQLTDLSLASVLAGRGEHQRLADLTARNRGQLYGETMDANRFYEASRQADFGRQFQNRQQLAHERQLAHAAAMAARQQAAQEAMLERQLPAQELTSLLSLAPPPGPPQFTPYAQYNVGPPDYMGAVQNQYAAQANAAAQRGANVGSIIGGLGNFVPALKSDRKLKTDIRRIGTADNGIPLYTFRYKADPSKTVYVGAMADEVREVSPHAVLEASGDLAVNYAEAF